MHPSMCTTGMFELRGRDAAHDRVGVAEEDGDVGVELAQDRIELGDDRADDLGVGGARSAELDVGARQVELADEDVLEVVGVVLPGPPEGEL